MMHVVHVVHLYSTYDSDMDHQSLLGFYWATNAELKVLNDALTTYTMGDPVVRAVMDAIKTRPVYVPAFCTDKP